jgi:glucose uptake protein GlcU
VSTGLSTIFWIPFILAFEKHFLGRPYPAFYVDRALVPGALSGTLWNMGNVGAVLATLPPLGTGIGYPLSQSALLVGCAWGIFVFKEIKKVGLFGVGAVVTLGGVIVAGEFGKSS